MGYSLVESIGSPAGAGTAIANTATKLYLATQWQAADTYVATQIGLSLKKILSPTFTLRGHLWVDDGSDNPNSTTVINSVNTVDASSLPDGYFDEFLFQFTSGLSIASGSLFWAGFSADGYDVSNYVQWQYGSYLLADQTDYSANGTSWTPSIDRKCIAKIYENDVTATPIQKALFESLIYN